MCKNAFLAGLLGSQYLLEILEVIKNTENLVKCMCFQKCLAMESDIFLHVSCVKIFQIKIFQINHFKYCTPHGKTSKNVVKSVCFWRLAGWRVQNFLEMNDECEVFCVKVSIYLKNYKLHELLKIVKTG